MKLINALTYQHVITPGSRRKQRVDDTRSALCGIVEDSDGTKPADAHRRYDDKSDKIKTSLDAAEKIIDHAIALEPR